MFGCCVAGRLLQTNLQQIDETHAIFEIPAASTVNHLCVFLLGTVFFPEGYGATVHLYWPGKGFQLLGMLSNEKPSAIFRLRGTFTTNPAAASHVAFSDAAPAVDPMNDITAVLGLFIEPLAQIEPQMMTLQSVVPSMPDPMRDPSTLAMRIVRHLFNYLSGFAGGPITPETTIPMGLVAQWFESFQGKVRAGGTGFLERME